MNNTTTCDQNRIQAGSPAGGRPAPTDADKTNAAGGATAMELSKQDSAMTKGLAILAMVVLHLFCRRGADVFGTPLLWLDSSTPLVYVFGFFAEICVPIYSFCAGYAQGVLQERLTGARLLRSNLTRVLKLLINYWIVLLLFCGLGLLFDASGTIPGSLPDFIKSIFLLHSYNGAWWFLNAYILLQLLAPVLVWLLSKLKSPLLGIGLCALFQLGWGLFTRSFDLIALASFNQALQFLATQLFNLIQISPCFLVGILFRQHRLFQAAHRFSGRLPRPAWRNRLILLAFAVLIPGCYLLHKAFVMPFVAILVILLFNLCDKPRWVQRVFCFLGKHSTNIWLTHMFFYASLFAPLVMSVRYPLFILLFLLALCILTSYVIGWIYKPVAALLDRQTKSKAK